jgi:methionine-S-sulfoxide reductase
MFKPTGRNLLAVMTASFLTATSALSATQKANLKPSSPIKAQGHLPPGDFARDLSEGLEAALFAGGCFWGMQEIIRKLPGVKKTQVGYTGGQTSSPSYKEVSSGKTGHAESVQLIFDPNVISYEQLLDFYFRMHDPTTLNQQGNDKGTQYRSAIFYYGQKQANSARSVRAKIDARGKWKKPVVTDIAPALAFWRAETEHQDYLQKNPNGYTCHYLRGE